MQIQSWSYSTEISFKYQVWSLKSLQMDQDRSSTYSDRFALSLSLLKVRIQCYYGYNLNFDQWLSQYVSNEWHTQCNVTPTNPVQLVQYETNFWWNGLISYHNTKQQKDPQFVNLKFKYKSILPRLPTKRLFLAFCTVKILFNSLVKRHGKTYSHLCIKILLDCD